MATKIAIIGECMVELKREGELYSSGFGGDTLNTALYLSRLTQGSDIQVSYLTGLGTDEFSQNMLASWQQEGIDTQLVAISEKKLPGLYTISTRENGERDFRYWRNDSAAKYWLSAVDLAQLQQTLSQYQLIYLSGISLAILPEKELNILFELLQHCKKQGVKIAFDNNYRPILWESAAKTQQIYQQVLALTNIAFLTFDDEVMLYGDNELSQCIARTQQMGVPEIVIKRGSEACVVVTPQERVELAPTPVKNVIDTTAAGDSFSAGYLSQRLQGKSILDSIAGGHKLAGTVIQHKGAVIDKQFMPVL